MKNTRLLPTRSLASFLILPVIFGMGGCDSGSRKYDDLSDANTAGEFRRNRLPPVLPRSSKNIEIEADPNPNFGKGRFDFNPADLQHYIETVEKKFNGAAFKSNGRCDVEISTMSGHWVIALPENGTNATFISEESCTYRPDHFYSGNVRQGAVE
jgi:hypothetical protein